MDELDELVVFLESALHADLPGNPGIESVSRLESNDRILGVELTSGTLVFIEVQEE